MKKSVEGLIILAVASYLCILLPLQPLNITAERQLYD